MNPAIVNMMQPGRPRPFYAPYSGPAPRALHPDAAVVWVNKPYASAQQAGGPPLPPRGVVLTLPYGSPHTHQHNQQHQRVGRDNCLGGLGQGPILPAVRAQVGVLPALGTSGAGGWTDADGDRLAALIEQRKATRAGRGDTSALDAQIRDLRRLRARYMARESRSWFLDLPPVIQGVGLLVGGVFAIRLLGVFKG